MYLTFAAVNLKFEQIIFNVLLVQTSPSQNLDMTTSLCHMLGQSEKKKMSCFKYTTLVQISCKSMQFVYQLCYSLPGQTDMSQQCGVCAQLRRGSARVYAKSAKSSLST